MRRFFVKKDELPAVCGGCAHQIKNVLRMKKDDQLELLDGTGKVYPAKIIEIEKEKIICEILSSYTDDREPRIKITLAQALPKSAKMDFIIEKCTELGAAKIVPMITARTIPRGANTIRWEKIAKEAAEQSCRSIIPEITEPQKFEEVVKIPADAGIIAWENEKTRSLKQFLAATEKQSFKSLLVLIGPEGGFTKEEIDRATEAGISPVSLGKRILRTETAGMAALSAIACEFE